MNFNKKIKQAGISTWNAFIKNILVLLGILILVSLSQTLIPKEAFTWLFSKNMFLDSFIGSLLGSILAGNPITSYILGGEMLTQGISLMAIVAFIVAWVTVGIVQLPAEAMLLGKKFAISRNIISFFFAIIVALITTILVNVL